MTGHSGAHGFLTSAKDRILEALQRQGRLRVSEMPRLWPVTEAMVAYLVSQLEEIGFLEESVRDDSEERWFQLTEAARFYLESRPERELTTLQFYNRPHVGAGSLS